MWILVVSKRDKRECRHMFNRLKEDQVDMSGRVVLISLLQGRPAQQLRERQHGFPHVHDASLFLVDV